MASEDGDSSPAPEPAGSTGRQWGNRQIVVVALVSLLVGGGVGFGIATATGDDEGTASGEPASTEATTESESSEPEADSTTTSTEATESSGPTASNIGDTVTASGGSMTVHAVEYPVVGTEDSEEYKEPGTEYAIGDVEVCSGLDSVTVLSSDVMLQTTDNRLWESQGIPARNPEFAADELPSGLCARGWITWEVDTGQTVSGVVYQGEHWNDSDPVSETSLVWAVA